MIGKMERMLERAMRKNTIIAVDVNARSRCWHCEESDGKGRRVEEMMDANELVL